MRASASATLADCFVRLSDVAPNGAVTLVTGSGLSGAQRDSAQRPTALVQNRFYTLQIALHFTS